LMAARGTRAQLAAADARFTVVAGIGQETVTRVRRRGAEFLYTLTRHGDGTVPTASALLSGAECLYARVAHSDLTRDAQVAAAVIDLLRHGRTTRLPHRIAGSSRACVEVSDRQLQRSHVQKVDWAALTPDARREFLENLNEPPHLRLRVPRARRGRAQSNTPKRGS
jgi:NAD(P)-dependent dehydrogenase (short-subunit alcohol dehydrogenase family)